MSPALRQELALAVFEDVLGALVGVPELKGIAIVTLDPIAADTARRWGAQVWTHGARATATRGPSLLRRSTCGLTPTVVRNRAIALDVDEPADLAKFMENRSATRSWTLLDSHRSKWDRTSSSVLASQ